MAAEPPPYLAYLETVVARVLQRDRDLLHPEEAARLAAFAELPLDAKCLLVRLLLRKGPWFRLDDLDYPEVTDRTKAREVLVTAGWCGSEADGAALASLLTRGALLAWLERFEIPVPKDRRREGLVQAFVDALEDPARHRAVHAAVQPLERLHNGLWGLVYLLFFGTFDQDLTVFIRTDLGQLRFEDYPLDPMARRFHARADVDFLSTLRHLRDALENGTISLEAATDQALGMETRPGVRAQRRFSRLLNDLGRAWERRGNTDRALACYQNSLLPPARERQVRIHAGLGNFSAACELAVSVAEGPFEVSESTFVEGFLRRHARKDSLAQAWVLAHPKPDPLPMSHLVLERPSIGRIEDAVLTAAKAQGWEGFFAENRFWNALFGLTFWEALFADVPGAFIHPFQTLPMDVTEPGFSESRVEWIEQGLAQFRQDPRSLVKRAMEKWGVANGFLNWKHLELTQLEVAIQALPTEALGQSLAYMAKRPWALSSGFPDLFLHRPGACALWEVKGPGDSLRPEQTRWLHAFQSFGLDVQVVRVTWA